MSSRWVSKPPVGSQINWGHPLSKGLVGCWLMNEGGGRTTSNLVSNIKNTSIGSPSFVSKPFGKAMLFTGTTDVTAGNIFLPQSTPMTMVYRARTNETTILRRRAIRIPDLAVGSMFTSDWGDGGNGLIGIGLRYDASNFEFARTTFSYEGNVDLSIAGTWKPGDYVRMYLNGNFYSKSDNVRTTSGGAGIRCDIGNSLAGNFPFNGSIYYVYIYNRALSPSEIQSLYESPYQFIKGPSTITYFTAPAVGGWTWGGEVKNVMVA